MRNWPIEGKIFIVGKDGQIKIWPLVNEIRKILILLVM